MNIINKDIYIIMMKINKIIYNKSKLITYKMQVIINSL